MASSFLRAGPLLEMDIDYLEPKVAYKGNVFLRKINWWLRGKRPTNLKAFNTSLNWKISDFKPNLIIVFGINPPFSEMVEILSQSGIFLVNFLTDDPWQPGNVSNWFIKGLSKYNFIFCSKKRVLTDCFKCNNLSVYLPFGYDGQLFQSDTGVFLEKPKEVKYDICFAGGADNERIPILKKLIEYRFKVGIHGDYWNRDPITKNCWLGHGTPESLRNTTFESKISLCLVRRANRDGHVMRSFEIAASGGCMLVEDTEEHREIFGPDGECVVYFANDDQMITRARWLLEHDDERLRLRKSVYQRIVLDGNNTYVDRLKQILNITGFKA